MPEISGSDKKRLQPRTAFFAVFFVSAAIQLLFAMQDPWLARPPKSVGDGLQYENIAFHLWSTGEYRFDNSSSDWRITYEAASSQLEKDRGEADYSVHLDSPIRNLLVSDRPPLYPMIVAGFYSILGRGSASFVATHLFSHLCLALSSALAAVVVLRVSQICFPKVSDRLAIGLAFLPMVFTVTNRTLQSYTSDFLTEPLAIVLMQGTVLMLVHLSSSATGRRARMWDCILAGVSLGALILTRSVIVLWLPGWFLLLLLLPSSSRKSAIKLAACVVLVACILCSPWWIRNIAVTGRFLPFGTQGTIALLGGYNQWSWENGGEWRYEAEQQLRSNLQEDAAWRAAGSDLERELMVYDAAREELSRFVSTHCADLPRIGFARTVTHWNPYSGKSLIWKGCILLGVGLLFAQRKRMRPDESDTNHLTATTLLYLGLPILSTLMAAILYTVGGRFLLPSYGLLNTLAALGVAAALQPLYHQIRRRE